MSTPISMATFLPQGSARYNRAPAPSTPKPPKASKPLKPPSKPPKPSRSSLSLRSMRSGLTTMTSRSSSSDDIKKPMLSMSVSASRSSIQTTSSASSGSTLKMGRVGKGGRWDEGTPRASSCTVREAPVGEGRREEISGPVLVVGPLQRVSPEEEHPHRPHPHPLSIPAQPQLSHRHLPTAHSAHLPTHPKLEDRDTEDHRVHAWISEQSSFAVDDIGGRENAVTRYAAAAGGRALGRAATIAVGGGNHVGRNDIHVPARRIRQPQAQHPRLRLDTGSDTPNHSIETDEHCTPTRRMGHVRAPRAGGWYWSSGHSFGSPSHVGDEERGEDGQGWEGGDYGERRGSTRSGFGCGYGLPARPPPPPRSTLPPLPPLRSASTRSSQAPSPRSASTPSSPQSSYSATSPASSTDTSPKVGDCVPAYDIATRARDGRSRHMERGQRGEDEEGVQDERERYRGYEGGRDGEEDDDDDDWDARCDSPLLGFGSDCSYSSFPVPPRYLPSTHPCYHQSSVARAPHAPATSPTRTMSSCMSAYATSPESGSGSGSRRRGSDSTEEEGDGEEGFPRTPGSGEEVGEGHYARVCEDYTYDDLNLNREREEYAYEYDERDPLRFPGRGYVRVLPSGLEDEEGGHGRGRGPGREFVGYTQEKEREAPRSNRRAIPRVPPPPASEEGVTVTEAECSESCTVGACG